MVVCDAGAEWYVDKYAAPSSSSYKCYWMWFGILFSFMKCSWPSGTDLIFPIRTIKDIFWVGDRRVEMSDVVRLGWSCNVISYSSSPWPGQSPGI
jgi:hypothetical protein